MQNIGLHSNASFVFHRLLARVLLFLTVWWILTGGDEVSWWFGVPVVLITVLTAVSLAPKPGPYLRLKGLVPFAVFFLIESVRGGIDVALRALRPSMPIHPAFIRFESALPDVQSRLFLAKTANLLPGTVSAEFLDTEIIVHTIDENIPVEKNLRRLEARVARLFKHVTVRSQADKG